MPFYLFIFFFISTSKLTFSLVVLISILYLLLLHQKAFRVQTRQSNCLRVCVCIESRLIVQTTPYLLSGLEPSHVIKMITVLCNQPQTSIFSKQLKSFYN